MSSSLDITFSVPLSRVEPALQPRRSILPTARSQTALGEGLKTVELTDYIRIIRKRWRIIAAAVVVCLAGAALATYVTPKIYQAQTRIFVSTPGAKDNKALMQGNSFTQSRVASYADVITNRLVLDPVIRTLNLDTTAAQLGSQITATVSPGTVLIEIDVTNADPRMAAQVADALAKQITHTVADLEGIAPDQVQPGQANRSERRDRPHNADKPQGDA